MLVNLSLGVKIFIGLAPDPLCFGDYELDGKLQRTPTGRDSGNDFCRFSFLGYPKRNDFVPSRTQKNQPGTMLV